MSKEVVNVMAGLIDPVIEQKSASFLQNTVKSTFDDDFECDPDTKTCLEGFANAYKIDKELSKVQIKLISDILNSVNDKVQEIVRLLKEYYVPSEDVDIDRFLRSQRSVCSALKIILVEYKKSKDKFDLDKAFRSLDFEHDKFIQSYNTAKDVFKKRAEYEPKSRSSTLLSQAWSLVKWIWKYKYVVYISGLLLYNINIYVFPEEITNGLNITIRLAGAICYTFASDRVSMSKMLEIVVSMFMLLGSTASLVLPDFIRNMGTSMPSILRKLFAIGNSVVFYIFTYFTIDWLSYLLKLVCQGIVIAGAAVQGGKELTEGLWLVFSEAKEEIGQQVSRAVKFIEAIMIKSGDMIMNMLVKIFVGVLYEGVILPAKQAIENIPSNVVGYISSLWKKSETGMIIFDESNYGERKKIVSKIMEFVKDTQDVPATEDDIIAGINAIATVSNTDLQVALSSNKEVFVHQVTEKGMQMFNEIKNIGGDTIKNAQKKTEDIFSSVIKKMGTEKLWTDLKKLHFTDSIVPYMTGIMLVISILSIMFGIVA